jgi:uncharacterized protein with HEPN domain
MRDAAREATSLIVGKVREDLDRDRLLNLGLIRLMEIVGEAGGRVSTERQVQHPEIPWRMIVGLRNRLIHEYDSVDFDILWAVLTINLPGLIADLDRLFGESQ